MNVVEFIKLYGWEMSKAFLSNWSFLSKDYGFKVEELKKLVDAWELIQKRGGLSEAKAIEQQYWNSGVGIAMAVAMELKQAIELVESVNENTVDN